MRQSLSMEHPPSESRVAPRTLVWVVIALWLLLYGSFALLRPIVDVTSQDKLRALILEAFAEFEERAAVAS